MTNQETNNRRFEILKENLSLPAKYENKSVLKMINYQEKLIKEWCDLGGNREDFFTQSRELNKVKYI